jgi:glutaryl-CoA dehydrogenase
MPDFFEVSRQFTPEERAVADTVRAFVDARVLPTIGDHFEKGEGTHDIHTLVLGHEITGIAACE